jgi:hypothetical protein
MGKQKTGAAASQAKIGSSRDEVERIFRELHLENSLLAVRL